MKNLLKLSAVAFSLLAFVQAQALTCPANTVQIRLNDGSYACEGLGGRGPSLPGSNVAPMGWMIHCDAGTLPYKNSVTGQVACIPAIVNNGLPQ